MSTIILFLILEPIPKWLYFPIETFPPVTTPGPVLLKSPKMLSWSIDDDELIKQCEPIFAPIKKGDSIGKIVILNDNDIIVETILISNEDIGVKNIVGKAIGAARYLIN